MEKEKIIKVREMQKSTDVKNANTKRKVNRIPDLGGNNNDDGR